MRQATTLEKLAAVYRETADQLPKATERVVNQQLDVYGRHWSALQQDTASQHTQALQDLVWLLKTMHSYYLRIMLTKYSEKQHLSFAAQNDSEAEPSAISSG